MRIETLEYFQEIVRCGSFTQAANNLFISQQGLSKAIAGLEKELGTTLLRRNGKQVVTTEAGDLLTAFAEDIVGKHRRLKEQLLERSAQANQPFENIPLVAMPYVANTLYNHIEHNMERCGLGDCIIRETSLADILDGIEGGSVTHALVNILAADFNDTLAGRKCIFIPLFSANIVLLASKALVAPYAGCSICAEDILKIPLAYYNEPILNRFVQGLARRENGDASSARLVQHSSNVERIMTLLHAGKAATFSDTFSVFMRKPKEHILALDIKPSPTFYVGFLVNPDLDECSIERRYVNRFRDMISSCYEAYTRKNQAPPPPL